VTDIGWPRRSAWPASPGHPGWLPHRLRCQWPLPPSGPRRSAAACPGTARSLRPAFCAPS